MSDYRIRYGDTLSQLAQRFGTSVDKLAQANGIKNPDVILAGASLKISGGDSFESKGGANPVNLSGRSGTGGTTNASGHQFGVGQVDGSGASQGASGSQLAIAQQYLNRNASEIKHGNDALGRAMQDWVPNNVNCANFISGALIASGKLPSSQGSAGVLDLMNKMDNNGFKRVSINDAKPGDIVSMRTNGGQHVVMFAGMKDGKPLYIGSNNVNSDGSQRVTYTQMQYPIMSVHRPS